MSSSRIFRQARFLTTTRPNAEQLEVVRYLVWNSETGQGYVEFKRPVRLNHAMKLLDAHVQPTLSKERETIYHSIKSDEALHLIEIGQFNLGGQGHRNDL